MKPTDWYVVAEVKYSDFYRGREIRIAVREAGKKQYSYTKVFPEDLFTSDFDLVWNLMGTMMAREVKAEREKNAATAKVQGPQGNVTPETV